ncbi:conserved exported protein of unknown function [Acidithiobacillus ferrivorans]|uniref:Lipoprotein n=1 Tax=Acidithiobacillus ferrivorans TaxID=160808 RepID=A0A060UKH4_9PROT|nr:hypothetical protein [Acidithiobacillus ferrivorans]CDQ08871.1 conserved exported hypothetical protein [Acidithiobacillus ferrivorans]SMH64211.1 conserved exported protein of unknown function [Acidithiobacillus ferrivorans]
MNIFRPVKFLIMASVMVVPLALSGCFFGGGGPSAKAEAAQSSAKTAQVTANQALAKANAAQNAQNEAARNANNGNQ